jgi:nucleotide-binding universal stress UspA family protein
MSVKRVCLDYGVDAHHVSLAASLARRLRALLDVRYAPPLKTVLEEGVADDTQERIARTMAALAERRGLEVNVYAQRRGPLKWSASDALIVSNVLAEHPQLPVLRPTHMSILPESDAPVLVPFGNKPDLEHGYRWGLPFAKALGCPVVLWHATWKRPGVRSNDAREHWHEGARAVAEEAQTYAQELGVTTELIVATPPNVVLSMHEAALLRGAVCIVVQQDENVIAGGYDEQLIDLRHEVPVVVLPKRRSR